MTLIAVHSCACSLETLGCSLTQAHVLSCSVRLQPQFLPLWAAAEMSPIYETTRAWASLRLSGAGGISGKSRPCARQTAHCRRFSSPLGSAKEFLHSFSVSSGRPQPSPIPFAITVCSRGEVLAAQSFLPAVGWKLDGLALSATSIASIAKATSASQLRSKNVALSPWQDAISPIFFGHTQTCLHYTQLVWSSRGVPFPRKRVHCWEVGAVREPPLRMDDRSREIDCARWCASTLST